MKIQVNRISNTVPFAVTGEISVDDFNRFMNDNQEEASACSPVRFSGSLKHCRGGFRFEAEIQAEVSQACVRCNHEDVSKFNLNVSNLLVDAVDSPKADEIILSDDDLDVVFFNNNEIDVDHLVLESIWSELDSLHLCNDDCRGLCPSCGKNLNDGDCDCSKS